MALITPTLFGTARDTGGMVFMVDPATVADGYRTYDVAGEKYERILDGAYRAAYVNAVGDMSATVQAILNDAAIKELVLDSGDVTINSTLTIPAGKKVTFRGTGRFVGTGTITIAGVVDFGIRQDVFASSLTIAYTSGGADVYVSRDRKTLAVDGTVVIPKGAYVTRVLVKPALALTAFKVGTTDGGEDLISTQPLPAAWRPVAVDLYCEAATTLYIGGISSSTEIIVFYE